MRIFLLERDILFEYENEFIASNYFLLNYIVEYENIPLQQISNCTFFRMEFNEDIIFRGIIKARNHLL